MTGVTWEEAKGAANRILFKLDSNYQFTSDPVSKVFNNSLPSTIFAILRCLYVLDYPRDDVDVQIILNAYEQLETKGWIGD